MLEKHVRQSGPVRVLRVSLFLLRFQSHAQRPEFGKEFLEEKASPPRKLWSIGGKALVSRWVEF